MDDHHFVERVKAGDITAFGPLYDKYVREIYRFVWYKTHHRETAEDITSTIFFKALERMTSFDISTGTWRGWLYSIARHAVIDHYRTRRPTTEIEDAWDIPSTEDLARDTEARDMVQHLGQHLETLTPLQRDILVLRVWQELSYAEIAVATGKSEAACKMAFARGSARLKDLMPVLALLLTIYSSR